MKNGDSIGTMRQGALRGHPDFDAIVLGGGFYGCCIALLLARRLPRVAIVERENALLRRASLINQARVHGGYHYPRSVMTAARSLVNFPRFNADFKPAIVDDFTTLYAIARHGSKVNAGQFYNFFNKLGAPIAPATPDMGKLFNPLFIEQAFIVRENVFDAAILATILSERLEAAGVSILFGAEAKRVGKDEARFKVATSQGELTADIVFNCLYSRINALLKDSGLPLAPLRHEITEMALVEPGPFAKLGLTVMDGPFFSLMPFPARGLHTLSHVRYTPQRSWTDAETFHDGYQALAESEPASHFGFMQRDAARFVPLIGELKQADTLFEVKTILTRNDHDDGRPILFREEPAMPNFFTVMGGKIDNIYDILETVAETNPSLELGDARGEGLFG